MNTFTTAILSLSLLLALWVPALAAELSIEPPLAGAEATVQIPVVFTASAETVNVVEGTILVPEGIAIERLDTSASSFSLFASGPTYVISSRTIEFTAGSVNSVLPHETALLFVIEARPEAEGSYTFTPANIVAYANDGTGSQVAVEASSANLSVGTKGSVAVDPLPKGEPQALIAEIGKDATLFEGKWFTTFYGGAKGAAIDHYEVREGWWRFPIRADRYYVLKDQGRGTTVWVTAIGTNGSATTVALAPVNPWGERAITGLVVALAAIAAFLLYRRLRRN